MATQNGLPQELLDMYGGNVISVITRQDLIEAGDLVDVTEWASKREVMGGYFPSDFNQHLWGKDDTPVCFSRRLWEEVNMDKPCPDCSHRAPEVNEVVKCETCRDKRTVKRIAGAIEDTRGRAHDVIWMSSLAAKGACRRMGEGDSSLTFYFKLCLTKTGSSIMGRPITLKGVLDGDGIWLGYPDED